MLRCFILLLLLCTILMTGCQKKLFTAAHQPSAIPVTMNNQHPMKDSLQWLVDKYIAKGIPGLQVAVRNKDGFYVASGGYTQVEDRQAWQAGTPSLLFSITKTYTAVLVLKYWERSKIDLDKPLTAYLDAKTTGKVTRASTITVRMLLNHSSGIVNFTELPEFLGAQLNNPLHQPTAEKLLQMIDGKPLLFEPGSDFSYSNTNFLLLHLILEKIGGRSFAEILRSEILDPLQLQQTWYAVSEKEASVLGFPNYYMDRLGNGQLENATRWNLALGEACMGFGGIAATPWDVTRFYETLMNGQVLSAAAMHQMKSWFKGRQSDQPDYGLGLEYFQYLQGSTPQMGHEGDGIGCTTMILYIPDNQTVLYINCIVGRKLGGPFVSKTIDLKNEISRYAARWR